MTELMDIFWHPKYVVIILELLGALILGLMVGYERSYRGRAAGMRTYGFVCMASCAMTTISGYPELWFGMHIDVGVVDPTRVIQGIITGIGFLGAGVIMRDGLNISGLTTAASIWAVSAVGILVGVGFYVPAIFLALVLMIVMLWGSKIERFFPAHHAVAVTLHFKKDFTPDENTIRRVFDDQCYRIANGSFATMVRGGEFEWRFVAVSLNRYKSTSLIGLSNVLSKVDGIQDCYFSHSRN
ncbi:MAG TPA: MgtC/SapB family protein [Alphaproteobacteria bacterium]|nr:MgtC/SapB family protein [Alphaproteobacteria bacterium]